MVSKRAGEQGQWCGTPTQLWTAGLLPGFLLQGCTSSLSADTVLGWFVAEFSPKRQYWWGCTVWAASAVTQLYQVIKQLLLCSWVVTLLPYFRECNVSAWWCEVLPWWLQKVPSCHFRCFDMVVGVLRGKLSQPWGHRETRGWVLWTWMWPACCQGSSAP